MNTQADNEKDPAWLLDQMGRYKAECSAVTRERDALLQQVKALEIQLADATGRGQRLTEAIANADGMIADGLARLAEANSQADQREAASAAAAAALRQKHAGQLEKLTGEAEAQKAAGHLQTERLHAAEQLAAKRKAALGSVMKAVGVVVETVAPLLDEQ